MAEAKTIALRIAIQNVKQAEGELRQFGQVGELALENLRAKAESAGAGLENGIAKGAQGASGGLRRMQADLQGVNFQLQDIIVQAQSGTSAFTIMTQQAPQLAAALNFNPYVASALALTGAIGGLVGVYLGFNQEIKETPEILEGVLKALGDTNAAFDEFLEKRGQLTGNEQRVVGAQAGREITELDKEAEKRMDVALEALQRRYTQTNLSNIDLSDETSIGVQALQARRSASARLVEDEGRLEGAVRSGDRDQVAGLLASLGIADSPEAQALLEITTRRKAAEIARNETQGTPLPELTPAGNDPKTGRPRQGFIRPPAAEVDLSRAADVPVDAYAMDFSTRTAPIFKPRDEAAAAAFSEREEKLLEQSQQRGGALWAAIFGDSTGEDLAEGIQRVNRQLDDTLKKIDDSLAEKGITPDQAGQLRGEARENAGDEIAQLKEREAAEQQAEQRKRQREAEERQRDADKVTAAQGELATAEKITAIRRADLEQARALTPERIHAANAEAAQAEIVALKRREAAESAQAAAATQVQTLEREVAVAQQAVEQRRQALTPEQQVAVVRDTGEAEQAGRVADARRGELEAAKAAGAEAVQRAQAEAEAAERAAAAKRAALESGAVVGRESLRIAQDEVQVAERIAAEKRAALDAASSPEGLQTAQQELEAAERTLAVKQAALESAAAAGGQSLQAAQQEVAAAERIAGTRRAEFEAARSSSAERLAALAQEVAAAEDVARVKAQAAASGQGADPGLNQAAEQAAAVAASKRRLYEVAEAGQGRVTDKAQEELTAAERILAVRRQSVAQAESAGTTNATVTRREVAAAEELAARRRAEAESAKRTADDRIAAAQRELQVAEQAAARTARQVSARPNIVQSDPAVRDAQAAQRELEAKQTALDAARRAAASNIEAANREAAATQKSAAAKREAVVANEKLAATGEGVIDAAREQELRLQTETRIREATRGVTDEHAKSIRAAYEAKLQEQIETEKLNEQLEEEKKQREALVKLEEMLVNLRLKAAENAGLTETQVNQLGTGLEARELAIQAGLDPRTSAKGAAMIVEASNRQGQIDANVEAKKRSDQMADVLLEPWRQLASQTSGIVAGIFDEFLATGRISMEELTQDIAGGLRGIVSGTLGTLITQPLNAAIADLGPTLNAAMQQGGPGFFGGLGQWAQANPYSAAFGAGALGLTAGNTVTALTGGNQMGSTIGGLGGSIIGGGIGSFFGPMGTVAGAGIGGFLGGTIGGLFGGGEENMGNDRARLDFWTQDGVTWQDENSSPENRRIVNQFADQVDSLVDALSGLGAEVSQAQLQFGAGNESGLEFQGEEYSSQEDLMNAVIRFIGTNTTGLSANQQTVLQTTEAGNVQEVAADLAFADQLDRVRQNMGPFRQQLEDLKDSFTAMRTRAEQLGLATEGLNAAYQRQRKEILDTARDQIDAFTGNRTQYGAQIDSIRDQAEELTQMGQELGLSTAGIASSMRRQIADVRDAVKDQIDAFKGNRTQYGSALDQVRDQFEEVSAAARDLGLSTAGLTAAYRRQIAEIRDEVRGQVQDFRTPRTGPGNEIDNLRQRFEDVRDAARDVGVSTAGLAQSLNRQVAAVRAGVREQVDDFKSNRTQFGSQIDALRNQFEELSKTARDVGVSTRGLNEAYRRQVEEIKDTVRDQVDAFKGGRTGYGEQLDALRRNFEEVTEAARDVGVSTAGITAAYNRQRNEIREEARESVQDFRTAGTRSNYAQAFRDLKDQYDEAVKVAKDLGLGTGGLQQSFQRQQADLRQQGVREIGRFTQGSWINQFRDLTEQFEHLVQVANDVGKGTDSLTDAYQRQVQQLDRAAEAAVRQGEQSYRTEVRGLQDMFEGLINPIEQALGPFGIGQGINAPQATVNAGIEQFREQLALARGGDVDAIQSLAGIGQQTVGAAREYGASGKEFTDIFVEVNRGLAEVQSRLQDRQLEALRGLESVGRETLDEMVKLRREGIENVRLELEQLRFEVRQLAERRAA